MSKEIELPKIGYLFHYPRLDKTAENFQLDIYISSVPTEKHFDVEHVRLDVKDPKNALEHMTITHPWHYTKTVEVCAGKVIMSDRNGEKVEGFTFGGKLTVTVKESETDCVLVSPAPILEISSPNPMHKLLAEELEVLLAKRKAGFTKKYEYAHKLCDSDPFDLYLACMKELVEKFEDMHPQNETYQHFLFFLHSHMHRMEAVGLLRGQFITLDDIFEK